MSFLDTIHSTLGGYASSTNQTNNVGQINEVTPEDMRKKRNKQLIISVIFVAVVIAAVIYLNKKNYIGKYLTFDYQTLSLYGVPLFAVGQYIRAGWIDDKGTFIPEV